MFTWDNIFLSDLGNTDEFTTEMLEWRLARSDLINYTGDLVNIKSNQPSTSTYLDLFHIVFWLYLVLRIS